MSNGEKRLALASCITNIHVVESSKHNPMIIIFVVSHIRPMDTMM